MARFVVVENTPGYMPEDDDPFRTDDIDEARAVLKEQVNTLVEANEEIGLEVTVRWGSEDYAIVETNAAYDLGRVVEVMDTTE